MPTVLQQNLAREILNNAHRKKPLNKKQLVVSSGYDLTTAEKQVPAVFNQKGVKEALKSFGLTEKLIKTALVNDIKKKPKNRLGELRLGAEILGLNNKEDENTRNVNIVIPLQVAQSFNINGTNTEASRSDTEQGEIQSS